MEVRGFLAIGDRAERATDRLARAAKERGRGLDGAGGLERKRGEAAVAIVGGKEQLSCGIYRHVAGRAAVCGLRRNRLQGEVPRVGGDAEGRDGRRGCVVLVAGVKNRQPRMPDQVAGLAGLDGQLRRGDSTRCRIPMGTVDPLAFAGAEQQPASQPGTGGTGLFGTELRKDVCGAKHAGAGKALEHGTTAGETAWEARGGRSFHGRHKTTGVKGGCHLQRPFSARRASGSPSRPDARPD